LGVKERRERQKLETRDGILAAARKIAREDGWGAVTIRRVAEMIEYSPPIIYEYFASKDALIGDLQRIGFDLLADTMRASGEGTADPAGRMAQMGRAYWRFAHESPELYQVMHGWDSASVPMENTLVGARKSAAIVREVLEDWARAEGVTLQDAQGAVETLWALLHGLITVEMLDRVGGGPERAEGLAVQALQDLLFAWRSRGGQ